MKKIWLGIILIAVMTMLLISPAFANPGYEADVYQNTSVKQESFVVDGFTWDYNTWAHDGSQPYLHNNDTYDYIYSPIPNDEYKYQGFFTYRDLNATEKSIPAATSAELVFVAKATNPGVSSFEVFDTPEGNLLGLICPTSTSYKAYSIDVSDYLKNRTQINDFQIVLGVVNNPQKGEQIDSNNVICVTYSRLDVTCEMEGFSWAEGNVYVNKQNFGGLWWYSHYWSSIGVYDLDRTDIAEVGINVEYWVTTKEITRIYAFFTWKEGGTTDSSQTYELGVDWVGPDHVVLLQVVQCNATYWQAFLTFWNESTKFIGYHNWAQSWTAGYLKSSLESWEAPCSNQQNHIVSYWVNMGYRNMDDIAYTFFPCGHSNSYPDNSVDLTFSDGTWHNWITI